MNRTHKPSCVALDVVVAAMLLALAAVDLYGGNHAALIDVSVVIVGYVTITLWVRRHATHLDDELAGELRLVGREGNVTVYQWQPTGVTQSGRRGLNEKELMSCEPI
jgi:hypothetical protein